MPTHMGTYTRSRHVKSDSLIFSGKQTSKRKPYISQSDYRPQVLMFCIFYFIQMQPFGHFHARNIPHCSYSVTCLRQAWLSRWVIAGMPKINDKQDYFLFTVRTSPSNERTRPDRLLTPGLVDDLERVSHVPTGDK